MDLNTLDCARDEVHSSKDSRSARAFAVDSDTLDGATWDWKCSHGVSGKHVEDRGGDVVVKLVSTVEK